MCFIIRVSLVIILYATASANSVDNKVFKEYCWGCHHETSLAFGPSFQEIANKRTIGEIQGHIIAPKSTYKQLGYKRSVMPSFKDKLTLQELDEVTNFILSFKKED